jgi:hypothetical protein
MPMATEPKQEAQTFIARLDRQKAQDSLSGAAAAPQFGQLKVPNPSRPGVLMKTPAIRIGVDPDTGSGRRSSAQ